MVPILNTSMVEIKNIALDRKQKIVETTKYRKGLQTQIHYIVPLIQFSMSEFSTEKTI